MAGRACELGWAREQGIVIDEDLGLSGSSVDKRSGFTRLTNEVALAHVGIVLGLEVSRLARNNADWYRLLELCGITDTLIGDNDGVYHPALFNDRLLLGLKGTMSEAELHIIRARLDGGIRNKAARRELRRGLPVGFVWGEQDCEVLLHPDQARGSIDAASIQANQGRLDAITRPRPHRAGGAVREGSALLQCIASCGHCGRRLHPHYRGRNSAPGYHCSGKDLVNGRGQYCLTVGGMAIEQAVANAFIEAVTPAAVKATLLTVEQLHANHDAALSQCRLELEPSRSEPH